MAQRIRHLIPTFLLCLQVFLPSALQAEEAPVIHEVSFYIAANVRIPNLHFGVFDEEGKFQKSVPLRFNTSGRSQLYEYQGPMPLLFFEEEKKPTEADPNAVTRTPVASISLQKAPEKVLLLFHPNLNHPDSGPKYSVSGVNLNDDAVPGGHISVFNFTRQEYMGAIGRRRNRDDVDFVKIKPGINEPVPIHPAGPVNLFAEIKDEGWTQVYDNNFQCDSDERLLLVLFPPRFPGSINIGGRLIRFPLNGEGDAEDGEVEETP